MRFGKWKTFGAVFCMVLALLMLSAHFLLPEQSQRFMEELEYGYDYVKTQVLGVQGVSGFVLNADGSSYWAKDGIGLLEWDKHVTESCKGERFLNITSYLASQDLDICIRTERPLLSSYRDAWLWKNMSNPIFIEEYVNETIQCSEQNETLEGCEEKGYYNKVYFGEEWHPDWFNIKDKFSHYSYGGEEFYCLKNVYFEKDRKYEAKIRMGFTYYHDGIVGCDEKFGLVAKRSSDSVADALENDWYVELDPYFSNSETLLIHYSFDVDGTDEADGEFQGGDDSLNVESGTPSYGSFECAVGGCLELNKTTSDYVAFLDNEGDILKNESFTTCAYQRVDIYNVQNNNVVWSYGNSSGAERGSSLIYNNAGTKWEFQHFYLADSLASDWVSNTTYTLHAWEHWCVTYDRSNDFYEFYKNGLPAGQGTASKSGIYHPTVETLYINTKWNLADYTAEVTLDEFVWFNESFSAEDIFVFYDTYNGVPPDVNTAPTCTQSDTNITVDEDSGVWTLDANMSEALNISCSDVDGDALTYTELSDTGTGGSFTNPNNDDIIFTTTGNASGTRIVVYTVSDGTDSIEVSAQATVTAINDDPWWDHIGNSSNFIEYEGGYQPININASSFFRDVENDMTPENITVSTNETVTSCWMDTVNNFSMFCNPDSIKGNFIVILNGTDEVGLSAIESFEVTSDEPPSIPLIIFPDNETSTDNETVYLSCSGSVDPEGDTIYYQFYGDTNNPPTTLVANSTSTVITWDLTVIGDYWWRCRSCDTYGICSDYNDTRFLEIDFENIKVVEENITFSQIGTDKYFYEVNVTYNDLRFSSIDAELNISNKTAYSLSKEIINSSVSRFYTNLYALEEWETLTLPYSWNFSLNYISDSSLYLYNSSINLSSIDVLPANFTKCNPDEEDSYLNFTFRDEEDNSLLNASIPSSSFVYSISSDQGVTKSYSYSELGENYSYDFCFFPNYSSIYVDIDFSYESTGYPRRVYKTDDTALTNSSTNTTLYLLKTADGSYTTFQVVNEADQALVDVFVVAQRLVGGTWTTTESKYTDDAGGATFWVNPDQSHRFAFTKSGYTDQTLTITPTQSSYTVTLSSVVVEEDFNYNVGVDYDIQPKNDTLANQTDVNFSFSITSSYFLLEGAGFILNNYAGENLGVASCTGEIGCPTSVIVNTGANNSQVIMKYYWIANNTYMNGTRTWSVARIYVGRSSFRKFFDDFEKLGQTFEGGGDSVGFQFTKSLLAFFIIFMVTAGASYLSGIYTPLAITGIAFTTTFFLDVVGFLPGFGIFGVETHFITVVVGLMFLSVIVKEVMK